MPSRTAASTRFRSPGAPIRLGDCPGAQVRGYGFNGQVPGPVLEAKQGVPLEIEFT